jgi:hypothetical protein
VIWGDWRRALCTADVDVADDRRPLCKLCISGGFSIGQAHSWVRSCLPEVPERLQGDEAHFTFHATFVPSLLKCTYKKGEAVFESDSVITLAILKDFVTKDATATKTTIDIASGQHCQRGGRPVSVAGSQLAIAGCRVRRGVDISDETVEHFLRMVGPILDFQVCLPTQASSPQSMYSCAAAAPPPAAAAAATLRPRGAMMMRPRGDLVLVATGNPRQTAALLRRRAWYMASTAHVGGSPETSRSVLVRCCVSLCTAGSWTCSASTS